MPETWGFKVRRAINPMAGARPMNSVIPLAGPFYSTTALWTAPNTFKVTILISCFDKLILISYTNYRKPIYMCKSQSDRCYGSTAVPMYAAYKHTCFLFIIIYVTWSCFTAPEYCRNVGLPAWNLPSLFSLHIFSQGAFTPIYGYITA